jgi:hypothetical protein
MLASCFTPSRRERPHSLPLRNTGRPVLRSVLRPFRYLVQADEGFTKTGDIRFTNGFVVLKNYGHLTYGYASTSHAAQGKTVDKVFVAMGQDALAASREQFYVLVSRGRESVKLYTDDNEAMLDAVKTSGQRLSATELLERASAGCKAEANQETPRCHQAKLSGVIRTKCQFSGLKISLSGQGAKCYQLACMKAPFSDTLSYCQPSAPAPWASIVRVLLLPTIVGPPRASS